MRNLSSASISEQVTDAKESIARPKKHLAAVTEKEGIVVSLNMGEIVPPIREGNTHATIDQQKRIYPLY